LQSSNRTYRSPSSVQPICCGKRNHPKTRFRAARRSALLTAEADLANKWITQGGRFVIEKLGHQNINVVNSRRIKRVAMVISNAATSTSTGWPVGFWWSELTHPFHLFTERGYEIEVFSPNGGTCKADAMSDPHDVSRWSAGDLISTGFIHTPEYARLVEVTRPVRDLELDAFDAIVVAGGQGPMFTFDKATDLHRKFTAFYEAGKVTAALCHGVAILRYAMLSNGAPLVQGKVVTGFANIEEDDADEKTWEMGALPRGKRIMPWRVEDEIKRLGGIYAQGGLWRAYAVRDSNLITGQQQFSGGDVAKLVINALGE
jgi:putative intracellular protease/amidase